MLLRMIEWHTFIPNLLNKNLKLVAYKTIDMTGFFQVL